MSIDITTLEGEELNAVSFVMDYVEFHFNGPVIRALTDPLVETADGSGVFPSPGSRDALCSLIGMEVQKVSVEDETSVILDFGNNNKIVIPLDEKSYKGPEALHWCPVNSPIQVWS